MDSRQLWEQYIEESDWAVKENSNNIKNFGGAQKYLVGHINREIWKSKFGDLFKYHEDGDLHIHDLTSGVCNYCFGGSLETLLMQGIQGIPNLANSSPAKHLHSLCSQISSQILGFAGEIAGAVAYTSFPLFAAPLWVKDGMDMENLRQCLQSLIFNLNQNTRASSEPCFSNLTVDISVPAPMRDKHVIIGGELQEQTYGEFEKEARIIAKELLKILIKGDAKGVPFAYPLITVNVSKPEDLDTEIGDLVCELSAKNGNPYFANFVKSSLSSEDTYSLCPLSPDTEIITQSIKGISSQRIGTVIGNLNKGQSIKVRGPHGWHKAKPVKVPMTKVYKIGLSDGTFVEMGENHLQPTIRGTLRAKNLVVGDWVPYNKSPVSWEASPKLGSWKLGFVVGAYIGDGSHDGNNVRFSLDIREKDDETEKIITEFFEGLGCPVNTTIPKGKVRDVYVGGKSYGLIQRFILGDNVFTKELTTEFFRQGEDFKEGVRAGLKATDGARACERYYTSSPTLRKQLKMFYALKGDKCLTNYVDTREGRLGKNPNYRLDLPNRENYSNLYRESEKFHHFSIVSMEEITPKYKQLYCLEVDSEDRLFMLSNGMFTHNCRLRLNKREILKKQGLFGGQPSTGSVGVVTLSLPKIASEVNGDIEKFNSKILKLMEVARDVLQIKRGEITSMFDRGLYPMLKMTLPGGFKTFFNTIGYVGFNEACLELFGKPITECKQFVQDTLDLMVEKSQDFQEETGDLFNVEASPAESAAYSLALKMGGKYKYFTNSCHIAVNELTHVGAAAKFYDELLSKNTGGSVWHVFNEQSSTKEAVKHLVKTTFQASDVPYLSFTPSYYVCHEHGMLETGVSSCPECGAEGVKYTRVTGYVRPVTNFNEGKKSEEKDRFTFNI